MSNEPIADAFGMAFPFRANDAAKVQDANGVIHAICTSDQSAERIAACLNGCAPFDDPESEIPELIEGFFEGKGEPSRDESVYYLTVRDAGKKETATLIIADTSEGAARRLVDCVNACESLPDPAADIAEMIDILRELHQWPVCKLREVKRIKKLLSKVEK